MKPSRSSFKTISRTAAGKGPRYYQVNAVNAAIEAIAKGRDLILLVMATGTGKSVSRADSANCPLPRPSGRRNLFLTRFSRLREFQVRNGLRELGYIEGQNLAIYYRSADGHSEHFPTLATELVRLEMSHKGGADAQVAERAGNDLERWRLKIRISISRHDPPPFF